MRDGAPCKYPSPPHPGMFFAFSTVGFWQTLWELSRYRLSLSRYSLGFVGLCVKRVIVTVSHAALRLLLCALRCFALHALRSARCMGSAFPRCVAGCEGFNNTGDDVEHGGPMVCEIVCNIGGFVVPLCGALGALHHINIKHGLSFRVA